MIQTESAEAKVSQNPVAPISIPPIHVGRLPNLRDARIQ